MYSAQTQSNVPRLVLLPSVGVVVAAPFPVIRFPAALSGVIPHLPSCPVSAGSVGSVPVVVGISVPSVLTRVVVAAAGGMLVPPAALAAVA